MFSLVNYVKSQALVEALDRQLDLRAIFGRGGIDWISRFNADDPIEDLVKYWKSHIKTSIEATMRESCTCVTEARPVSAEMAPMGGRAPPLTAKRASEV